MNIEEIRSKIKTMTDEYDVIAATRNGRDMKQWMDDNGCMLRDLRNDEQWEEGWSDGCDNSWPKEDYYHEFS